MEQLLTAYFDATYRHSEDGQRLPVVHLTLMLMGGTGRQLKLEVHPIVVLQMAERALESISGMPEWNTPKLEANAY